MGTINTTDTLFVTVVTSRGISTPVKIKGVSSMGEVVTAVRRNSVDTRGMVTLKMRNFTQGWSHSGNMIWR